MTPLRVGLAIAAGLALGTLPFLRYAHLGHSALPHADHAPRHGGQLRMVGDHHIELVRQRDRVQAFVSDAERRPVRASAGLLSFGGGDSLPMRWDGHRLVARATSQARVLDIVVILEDDTQLSMRFARADAREGTRDGIPPE